MANRKRKLTFSIFRYNPSFDPTAEEGRMSNREANAIYELDRCIECGCCLAACATAQMPMIF